MPSRNRHILSWLGSLSWTGLGLAILFIFTDPLCANPSGGTVVAGSATISGQGTHLVTVNQSTTNSIINWNSFSINSGELTRFVLPSSNSAVLDRVTGLNPSAIFGSLQSNGRVYLINPNGILVGPGGTINTAGFLGSTLDVDNQSFLNGGDLHFTGTSTASVVNLGSISVTGGDLFLLAQQVDNEGNLSAPNGTVGMAGGTDVWIRSSGDERVLVQPSSGAGTVRNGLAATVQATQAEIQAAGGNEFALAINNAGVIQATGVNRSGGHIYLTANSGSINNSGVINASATGAGGNGGTVSIKAMEGQLTNTATGQVLAVNGPGGKGGSIETSGHEVSLSGKIEAGVGGNWLIDPVDLRIDSSAATTIDGALNAGTNVTEQTTASGSSGAGTVNSSGNGDIILAAALSWSTTASLTLDAYRNIIINAPISIDGGFLNPVSYTHLTLPTIYSV